MVGVSDEQQGGTMMRAEIPIELGMRIGKGGEWVVFSREDYPVVIQQAGYGSATFVAEGLNGHLAGLAQALEMTVYRQDGEIYDALS